MAAFSLSDVRFAYATTSPAVLSNVTLEVAPRSRVVLVGANGAGKSTLLRLVAGRRRASGGSARTLGGDAFECTTNALRVNLVTADWESDLTLPVSRLVAGAVRASGASVPRVSRLIEALGVEELLEKELHSLSDGQQRRVQLFCKLLPERDLVLLDEATNSLDVLSRAALLSFLREESEGRGATVVFATHIFDGLDGWATDLVHLDGGMLLRHLPAASLARASLHATVSSWLLEHAKERRRAGDAAGRRTTDDLARSLVAAATAAVSEAHAAAEWSAALKRSRPAPAEDAAVGPIASVTVGGGGGGDGGGDGGGGGGGDGGVPLPLGWKNRVATLSEGGFGSHTWGGSGEGGAGEGGAGEGADGAREGPPDPPALPPASPPPSKPALPDPPPPPASSVREASTKAASAMQPKAPPMPAAAQRIAPVLQGALGALSARVGTCSAAVGIGDAAAAAAAAAEIASIWKQAQQALQMFEAACGAPVVCTSRGGAGAMAGSGGGGGGSGGGLPAGWGERHNTLPEAELVRRGAILAEEAPRGAV